MSASFQSRSTPFCRLLAILALLALTACENDIGRRKDHGPDDGAPPPDDAVPEMAAHGMFFGGKIEVETLLNRGGFAGREGGGPRDNDSGSGGGPGGGARRGGGEGGPGGLAGDTGLAVHIRPSNQPAVRLHLRLTNHGPTPVEVAVTDFNSELGDFVVEPPTMELPPGEPVEADPMTSRLGVGSNVIPLTISVQLNGKPETRVLSLQAVQPPAPPPPLAP